MANGEDKQLRLIFPTVVTPQGDGTYLVRAGRPVPEKQIFTVPEAATEMGTSDRHVMDLIDEGRLEAYDVGGGVRKHWRIRRSAIEKFQRERSNLSEEKREDI